MSSMIRTIQRTITRKMLNHKRGRHYMGRGSKLGVKNPRDKALIARLAREERNFNRKADKRSAKRRG